MATQNAKNILVAPLDWGLGHTTRCVPLVRYLQGLGHNVIVAGNKAQCSFFARSFERINTVYLEGYNVTYSRWNQWAQAGLVAQFPAIRRQIQAEHAWLLQKTAELGIDGVISDNRYGLHHPGIPSVIMTHQLRVLSGMGHIIDRVVQRVHYKYLQRFSDVWVVDTPLAPGLAGVLSHPGVQPKHHRYIGLLSEFDNTPIAQQTDGSLLVLLSGPEPQRSELAKMLWQQVTHYQGKVVFIEGMEDAEPPGTIPGHITYHKRLTRAELLPLLQMADIVICRSGYSTVMDLVAMHKKALLIPTPGQTEQEYLGRYLAERGIFFCARQKGFSLRAMLSASRQFPYEKAEFANEFARYKMVLNEWLTRL